MVLREFLLQVLHQRGKDVEELSLYPAPTCGLRSDPAVVRARRASGDEDQVVLVVPPAYLLGQRRGLGLVDIPPVVEVRVPGPENG